MRRLLLVLPLLAAGPACSGSAPEAADAGAATIRIAAIPDAGATELDEKYALVARALSEALDGIPVEYVPIADYPAAVAAFKGGDVQLAWFGGVTGVQARHAVPGARAIAFGRVDPTFKSYVVAHPSAGVEPSESFPTALRGKRFTFGNAASTSGHVMPRHFILQETGEAPEDFFGSVNANGGTHPMVARAVESGAYEAGVLNYKTWETMVAAGELDPEQCVKVWETPTYADYNWTAHPDLESSFGEGFIDRLQRALVGIEDPDVLAALTRPEGLIAASNDDFAAIEAVCLDLGMIRER